MPERAGQDDLREHLILDHGVPFGDLDRASDDLCEKWHETQHLPHTKPGHAHDEFTAKRQGVPALLPCFCPPDRQRCSYPVCPR